MRSTSLFVLSLLTYLLCNPINLFLLGAAAEQTDKLETSTQPRMLNAASFGATALTPWTTRTVGQRLGISKSPSQESKGLFGIARVLLNLGVSGKK